MQGQAAGDGGATSTALFDRQGTTLIGLTTRGVPPRNPGEFPPMAALSSIAEIACLASNSPDECIGARGDAGDLYRSALLAYKMQRV